MSTDPNISYTSELFKSIFNEINEIADSFGQNDICFNGIWPFLYYKGSNSLKSLSPIFKNSQLKQDLTDNENNELGKTVINCDYGSIGFALKNIKLKGNGYDYLHRTFNEPRGVVCYLDSKIQQEHAIFIAIKDLNNNILGILDIFLSGNVEEELFKEYSAKLFQKYNDNNQLKRLCTNTFIIQQFNEYQEQSSSKLENDPGSSSPLKPITKIETILKLSGNTPIFYFSFNNYPVSEEYVGLNFENIYGFVSHEYRFCSYVKKEIECYFNKRKITNNLSCQNSLLTDFYYDIIKENIFKSIRKEISFSSSDYNYIIEIVCEEEKKYEKDDVFSPDNVIDNIDQEIDKFKKFSNLNDVAKNKFRDELFFSQLKKVYTDAIVLILYRKVKQPYLIFTGNNCNKHNESELQSLSIKDYISPSELLHYKYTSKRNKKPLLELSEVVTEHLKWNVIHFEILKPNFFIRTVKKKIASYPQKYCETLKPYLSDIHSYSGFKVSSFNESGLKNLKLHYLGTNPQDIDYFKSVINEQISLISTEHESKETIKHARRAAIAQVMVRNLSHMQGSHVLANVLNLSELNSNDAKILLHYLKLRQEFLADISTASAEVNFPHDLYEDVLSKFSPVTNSERGRKKNNGKWSHDSSSFYAQQNKSTYTNNYPRYVIDNISGKSNLKLEQVKFCYKFLGECLDEKTINFNNNTRTLSDGIDISVDIPNDVIGVHALYILLENIIRNSAKHSECSELTYNFNLCEDAQYPDYYKVDIADNLGDKNKIQRMQEGWLSRIESYIYNSILKENKLRDGGWGILEMKICTAYLVSFPLEQIDSYDKDIYEKNIGITIDKKTYPPLLKLSLDNYYNLCHTFYLRKPKLALVIDQHQPNGKIGTLDTPTFKNKGIYTGTQKEWNEKGTEHSFLVIVNDNLFNSENHEKKTNQDVLLINGNFLSSPNPDEFIDKIWVAKLKDCQTPIQFVSENTHKDISGIVFDDHGQWGNSNPEQLKNLIYYEPFSSQTATCQILKARYDVLNESNGLLFKSLEAQIRDAAHIGIIVIDERIQLATSKCEKIKNTEYFTPKILDGMGIYVPIPQTQCQMDIPEGLTPVNLSASDFKNEECLQWINHYISYKLNVKYLVIHLGIIEKLVCSNSPEDIIKWIEDKNWLSKKNKSKNIRIVVTSGRGLPSNLPDEVLYVPISSVQQYVVNYRSKLMLVKLLKSIRKIYKNKYYE